MRSCRCSEPSQKWRPGSQRPAVKFAAIADWADQEQFPVAFMCQEPGGLNSLLRLASGTAQRRATLDERLTALIVSICDKARGNPGAAGPGRAGRGGHHVSTNACTA